MSFVENYTPKVGDRVITTKEFESFLGHFEIGSEVIITGIGERGYDIQDDEGHRVTECGWSGFKPLS